MGKRARARLAQSRLARDGMCQPVKLAPPAGHGRRHTGASPVDAVAEGQPVWRSTGVGNHNGAHCCCGSGKFKTSRKRGEKEKNGKMAKKSIKFYLLSENYWSSTVSA